MKKRGLSPIELRRVVELRQLGAKWTEIEHETKVERRAAKRAYEEWERDKKMREEKAARFRVEAEAFHEHLNDLTRLAGSLAINLDAPSSLAKMDKNTEQFFSWLLDQDLLLRYKSSQTPDLYPAVYSVEDTPRFDIGRPQFYRREKELLFESLKVHTRERVRWEALNEWGKARDNCLDLVATLQKEASEVVNNLFNQEREINFLQRVKETTREDDPVERVARGVLNDIWRRIVAVKLDEEGPWFQAVSPGPGSTQDIDTFVESRDAYVLRFIGTNMGLANKVTRIYNLAADNLCKGDVLQQLHDEATKMKKASEELCEMLNPVKLRPIILGTRCELCPV